MRYGRVVAGMDCGGGEGREGGVLVDGGGDGSPV